MAKKVLVDYLKKEVAAGYSVSQLRTYLVKQGYSQKDVDEAIDSLYGKKIPITPIVTVAVIIVVVFGLAFGIYQLIQPGEVAPRSTTTTTIRSGMQTTTTTTRSLTQITIPDEEEPEEEVQTFVIPEPEPKTDLKIGAALERVENMDKADAINLCKKYYGKDRDNCLKRVAISSGDTTVCALVEDDDKRDECYFIFSFSNDFTVCDKIVNPRLKQSCREFGTIQSFEVTS